MNWHPASRPDGALRIALPLLVSLVWIGGGVTEDVTAVDEVLELLALPVLVMATATLLSQSHPARIQRIALLAAGLVVAVPLLQLLPLPASLSGLASARVAIAQEMTAAGVSAAGQQWSLMPAATERGLLALLPALACFVGGLARDDMGRLPQLVVALVLVNLVFGFIQVGLPPGSALRLYPIGSGFGGVFANDNHQGTALIVGMLLSLGLLAQTRRRQRHGEALTLQAWAYAVAALACLLAIPLTTSRAAMLISLVFLALASVATGWVPLHRIGRSRRATLGAAVMAILIVSGIVLAWKWMQVDAVDEIRQALAAETLRIGNTHAPFGSGIGSFVNVFAQGSSALFQQSEYINHAHNEFAQWWLEGGVLAMIALAIALFVLGWTGWRLLRDGRHQPVAVACWLAAMAVLTHSLVDFPLRTLGLMSVTALLAGLAVKAAAETEPRPVRRRMLSDHSAHAA